MTRQFSVRRVLIAAKALIVNSDNWLKGRFAAPSNKRTNCRSWDPEAVCFCAAGAITRASGAMVVGATLDDRTLMEDAKEAFLREVPTLHTSIARFNDALDTRHDDVLRVFDKAIAATMPHTGSAL